MNNMASMVVSLMFQWIDLMKNNSLQKKFNDILVVIYIYKKKYVNQYTC